MKYSENIKPISFLKSHASEIIRNLNKSKKTIIKQMIVYPIGKFINNFILELGFLDGWRGLIYAFIMSLHSLWVRVYWYEKAYVKN